MYGDNIALNPTLYPYEVPERNPVFGYQDLALRTAAAVPFADLAECLQLPLHGLRVKGLGFIGFRHSSARQGRLLSGLGLDLVF